MQICIYTGSRAFRGGQCEACANELDKKQTLCYLAAQAMENPKLGEGLRICTGISLLNMTTTNPRYSCRVVAHVSEWRRHASMAQARCFFYVLPLYWW